MLDKNLSNIEYRCYSNICKDGRIRCLLIYADGRRRNISYPRLLMEQFLGRELLPIEQIHHKDENPLNNEISNLEIVKIGEHQSFHSKKQKRYPESDEARKKKSDNAKRNWSEGVYANRKNAHNPKSEEHKRKIAESIKAYYERKKST